jgi:hypothetical protein
MQDTQNTVKQQKNMTSQQKISLGGHDRKNLKM